MIFDPHTLQKYRFAYLKLRVLSGSSRYYVLNIVRTNQPVNVTRIVEISKLEQPIVSQLLSVLKKAEFVEFEAIKKEKYYSLIHTNIEQIILFSNAFLGIERRDGLILSDSYAQIQQSYKILKYLLNPTRLSILEILERRKEVYVNELVELIQLPQSIVSQNLRLLNEMNVVQNKVFGRKSMYSIAPEKLVHFTKTIEEFFPSNF